MPTLVEAAKHRQRSERFPRAPISTSHLQFFDKQWVDQTIRQEVTCLAVGGGYVVVGTSARSVGQKYIAEIWSLTGIADDYDPGCGPEADAPSFLRFAVGHREPIYACAAEAGRIATGGDDCTYDSGEPSSITRLLGPGTAAVGPEQSNCGSGAQGLRHEQSIGPYIKARGKVWALSMADGALLAVGGDHPEAKYAIGIWDLSGMPKVNVDRHEEYEAKRFFVVELDARMSPMGRGWGVRSVALEGRAVVAGGDDGVLRVWGVSGEAWFA